MRFLAKVVRIQRREGVELSPELKAFDLSGTRKQSGHGANCGRFGGAESVGGGRFVARFPPFFLIDQSQSVRGMSPGLPTFDITANRTREKDDERGSEQNASGDYQTPTLFALSMPQFLRRKHEIGPAHSRFPSYFRSGSGSINFGSIEANSGSTVASSTFRLHHDQLEHLLAAISNSIFYDAPAVRPIPIGIKSGVVVGGRSLS